MVLAQRENFNVLDDDQLVMILVEDGAVDNLAQVLLISLCEKQQRLCVAIRCVQQPLPVWVLSNALEDGSHGAGQLRQTLLLLLVGGLLSLSRSLACRLISRALSRENATTYSASSIHQSQWWGAGYRDCGRDW